MKKFDAKPDDTSPQDSASHRTFHQKDKASVDVAMSCSPSKINDDFSVHAESPSFYK